MNPKVKETYDNYVLGNYGRLDLCIDHGAGAILYDTDGKRYLDLGSGIAVNTFGACDPVWKQAVTEQAGKIQHTSNYYYSAPQGELAKRLCEKTGMDKAFFSNSGAEANECAIKTARKYSSDKYGEGRHVIVTMKGGFHGRTMAALTATGQENFHRHFGPFNEGFVYVTPNDPEELKAVCRENRVCAVMFEPIQGEGGVQELEPSYLQAMAELAQDEDILLIADEVQTGNGRTGTFYAYMQAGIQPDLVTSAKGLAGGLPIGVTLFTEKVSGVLTPGTHGSTFGGNPVCAAAACSVVERLTDSLMRQVADKGAY
ncbi:MAG: aminotransferase class III-fold pyridoxal phosphate-dependent enzyme, partial [Clostridiales bacterium]|nr:aminotransferase class III-fold pyridoxal phosphate-dependent enzyme [Clostridiales bacterium]